MFQDESTLIWYYGKDEKHLELHYVSRIIPGQRTVSMTNDFHNLSICVCKSVTLSTSTSTLFLIGGEHFKLMEYFFV